MIVLHTCRFALNQLYDAVCNYQTYGAHCFFFLRALMDYALMAYVHVTSRGIFSRDLVVVGGGAGDFAPI